MSAEVRLGHTDARWAELTDLIWRCEEATGERVPVRLDDVVDRLGRGGQRRAARIAARLPAVGGVLDADAVDALMLRVHCELQRLDEELQLPRRVAHSLREWLVPLLAGDASRPVRVVDVGCGLGYVTRWLAAYEPFGPRVEVVGVDFNGVLIGHATELARAEGLKCVFVRGDALEPGVAVSDPARTVVISSGLLHHLDVPALVEFFAAHERLGVRAFAHWDVDPARLATLGAWVFHQARMREPVSRHDGVMSARRAYPAAVLRDAARQGAPSYAVRCADPPRWRPPLVEVVRPIVGSRA